MTTTPHHIGQVTKAQITIAEPLERWGLTEPADRARYLVQQLQNLGWTPPRDPAADTPPLAGPGAPPDSPGRREFAAARAALAQRHTHTQPDDARP